MATKPVGSSGAPALPSLACAIYTRKSSEEGLEQDFNSLHAQREACEAFVLSQKGLGWSLIPTAYDDGGFSGGNVERPALRRLIQDIEAGKVNAYRTAAADAVAADVLARPDASVLAIFGAGNQPADQAAGSTLKPCVPSRANCSTSTASC